MIYTRRGRRYKVVVDGTFGFVLVENLEARGGLFAADGTLEEIWDFHSAFPVT